jgi:hypothetical protein
MPVGDSENHQDQAQRDDDQRGQELSHLASLALNQAFGRIGSRPRETLMSISVRGARIRMIAIQPLAHFLAGLEERNALLVDGHMCASARITPGAGRSVLYRESAEAAQLDAITARERRYDLLENRIHNVLDIPLVQMRVVLGDTLNKFGFDHRVIGPGNVRMTISVKMR